MSGPPRKVIDIRMISWNVNGIRAAIGKGLLEFVGSDRPDVLCIQETKAHPDQLGKDILEFPGYFKYFSSAEKKGYSGVTTWTTTEPLEVEHGLGEDRFDIEGRILITHFKDLVLFNVYFPNGKQGPQRLEYKMEFYDLFLERIERERKRKHVVFCGDVNTAHREIDLARPKENETVSGFLPEERRWIDRVIDRGFVDTFRRIRGDETAYSWWDYKTRARERNIGWRIDYFFVDEGLLPRLKDAFILSEIEGSDHCPVGIDLGMV